MECNTAYLWTNCNYSQNIDEPNEHNSELKKLDTNEYTL